MAIDEIPQGIQEGIRKLMSPKGYLFAGYPRYMGLFGRDSLISGWQLLNYDPGIARNSLAALAGAQGQVVNRSNGEEPGKILHEYYPKDTVTEEWVKEHKGHLPWLQWGVPVYFSVDATPLFLIVLEKYYERTKDLPFLDEIWENAMMALRWTLNYGMKNGFLRYDVMGKEDGLLSQSWKDGADSVFTGIKSPVAVVEVQGYMYAALHASARLLGIKGDFDAFARLEKSANELRERFNGSFWMEREKYYALALDGDDRQVPAVTSNPGHLLFTGILNEDRATQVVRRLFAPDMLTPYGIRTESTSDRLFDSTSYQAGSVWPHDNWIIAQGLRDMGFADEYDVIRKAVIGAYRELGSIPEYYGVANDMITSAKAMKKPACDPQAWSLGALISFME